LDTARNTKYSKSTAQIFGPVGAYELAPGSATLRAPSPTFNLAKINNRGSSQKKIRKGSASSYRSKNRTT